MGAASVRSRQPGGQTLVSRGEQPPSAVRVRGGGAGWSHHSAGGRPGRDVPRRGCGRASDNPSARAHGLDRTERQAGRTSVGPPRARGNEPEAHQLTQPTAGGDPARGGMHPPSSHARANPLESAPGGAGMHPSIEPGCPGTWAPVVPARAGIDLLESSLWTRPIIDTYRRRQL